MGIVLFNISPFWFLLICDLVLWCSHITMATVDRCKPKVLRDWKYINTFFRKKNAWDLGERAHGQVLPSKKEEKATKKSSSLNGMCISLISSVDLWILGVFVSWLCKSVLLIQGQSVCVCVCYLFFFFVLGARHVDLRHTHRWVQDKGPHPSYVPLSPGGLAGWLTGCAVLTVAC